MGQGSQRSLKRWPKIDVEIQPVKAKKMRARAVVALTLPGDGGVVRLCGFRLTPLETGRLMIAPPGVRGRWRQINMVWLDGAVKERIHRAIRKAFKEWDKANPVLQDTETVKEQDDAEIWL